eukprot:s894_g24.t1
MSAGWIRQLLAAWPDRLRLGAIHLVFPDVPDPPGVGVHADVILTQGSADGRGGGHHTTAAGTVVPAPAAASSVEPAAEPDVSHDVHEDAEDVDSESLTSAEEALEGVHVYSFRRPAHHFFVRWTTYNAVLLDIARQLRLSLHDVIGLHYLQAATIDQHAAEEAVILQYVGDLQPGTTDQLVLIDVEIQYHSSTPTVDRHVHRVPNLMSRAMLLRHLHLADYCDLPHMSCQITWNHQAWLESDDALHAVQHGLYLRVTVPPPQDSALDTDFAIEVADLLFDSDVPPAVRKRLAGLSDCDPPGKRAAHVGAASSASTSMRLLQTAIVRSRQLLQGDHDFVISGTHCQLDPVDAAVPAWELSYAPPVRPQPALPARAPFDDLRWLQGLERLFTNGALIENEDEGPIAYVNTWLIQHHRYPLCATPRPLRLTTDVAQWAQDLATVWNDLLDTTIPCVVHLVRPAPPCTSFQCSLATLIIEQEQTDFSAAVLLSVLRAQGSFIHLHQTAQSVPAIASRATILRHADPQSSDPLQNSQCSVSLGDRPFGLVDPEPVRSGCSLVIRVHPDSVRLLQDQHALVGDLRPDSDDDSVDLLQLSIIKLQTTCQDALALMSQCPHEALQRERLTSGTVAQARWPRLPPVPLCLDSLIETPTMISVDFRPVLRLRTIIFQLDLGAIQSLDSVVKWHDSTLHAFSSTPCWKDELPLGFSFFTDGSSAVLDSQRCSSAAVVLVVHTRHGDRFGGFRCFDTGIGAFAPFAELASVVGAALWACQLCDSFAWTSISLSFNFDCMFAGMTGSGLWRAEAHPQVQYALRSLILWLQQRFQLVPTWHHIPAHSGHPWNEAADAVSWASVSGWIPSLAFEQIYQPLVEDLTAVHWLETLELASQGHPSFPPIYNGFMQVNASLPLCVEPSPAGHPFLRRCVPPTIPLPSAHFTLRCATANVMTLYQNRAAHGKGATGRMEALLRDFARANIQVIGIQESRSQMQGHSQSQRYHILSAPATGRGVGGIQLWIHERWPHSHGPLLIRHCHLRILASSAQHLLVRLHHDDLKLLFLVAHAPPCPTFEEATSFWTMLSKDIPSAYRSWPLIALLDANARVGSQPSSCVGTFGAEAETLAGECFHAWLQDQDLFLPQTDESFHDGPHATWTHSSGHEGRLDFVALSLSLRTSGIRTQLADVDLTITKPDHRCVLLELPLPCTPSMSPPVSPPSTNLAGLATAPPCVPWHSDVHSHAASLQLWMTALTPPKPRQQPRKGHLCAHTWALIQHKRHHWQRLRALRTAARFGCLRAVFAGWKTGSGCDDVTVWRPWLRLIDHSIAWHSWFYHYLCLQVTEAVRNDDRLFFAGLAARQGDIAADEGITGLWKHIKHLLPKHIAKRKSNTRCSGPCLDELHEHYCALEAGSATTYPALLHSCAVRQRQQQDDLPLAVNLCDLPTCTELEQVCKLAKKGRAPGLDSVAVEQLQSCLQQYPGVFHALMMKIWLVSAEPVQFKGGTLCSIAKKAGTVGARTAAGMRGIMVLDCLAKLHHAMLRRKLLPWASEVRLSTQYGGYRGQQTPFASILLRSYSAVAAAKQVSLAVLFLDVRNAFHCLLRQHAFGTTAAFPCALRQTLEAEGLNVQQLIDHAADHAAPFETVNPMVARLVKDAHQDTWFTCPGSNTCHATTRGSRPGSPLADIAYNIMMTSLLRKLQAVIGSLPTIMQANVYMQCAAPVIAWVDDIALPLPCLDASQLDLTVQLTMQKTHDVFNSFGLRLNCAPGKTEATMQFRGPGAPQLRRERFLEEHSLLPILHRDPLRIVSHYTHLGLVFASKGDIQQDLKVKIGKASHAFRTMGRTIFHNRKIAVPIRLKLFESLIVGSGFWSADTTSDAEFRALWRIPGLSVRLAKHRLLFLLQLYRSAPRATWDFILAEDEFCSSSWLHAVRHALRWLATMMPHLPAHDWTREALLAWLAQVPSTMAQQIRRAVARHLTQEQTIHHVAKMHRDIKTLCQTHGVVFDVPGLDAAGSRATEVFSCASCSSSFSTVQGLNAHRWRRHGEISLERRYVYSGVCEACRRCFWTAQRLQQHLRYSRRKPDGCFWWLQKHLDPLSDPVPVSVPPHLHGHHRLPWIATAGPVQPHISTLWERRHLHALQRWQVEWDRHEFPDVLDESLCDSVHDRLTRAVFAWCTASDDDLQLRWCDIMEYTSQVEHLQAMWAFALWGRMYLYEVLDLLEDVDLKLRVEHHYITLASDLPICALVDRLDSLQRALPPPDPDPELPCVHDDRRQAHDVEPLPNCFENAQALLHPHVAPAVLDWPLPQGVPLCVRPDGSRFLLFLHLFSGRRRPDDCHDWLHRMAKDFFPDIEVVILSLDTAVGGAQCDLLSGPGVASLARIVAAGLVAGVFSGPPCETWSAARHLDPPEFFRGRWPRPLRSMDRAWGLSFLTHRELLQLDTGSALMLINLKLEIGVVLGGGAAMMEHPDEHENPEYPSTWRTLLQRNVCGAAPLSKRVHIQQWRYGASAIKPTVIRTMNLPFSAKTLHAHCIPGLPRPDGALAGIDPVTGQWRTSSAKEYPSGLSRALVATMLTGLHHRHRSEGFSVHQFSVLSEHDQEWLACVQLQSLRTFATTFLPDFQPQR